MGQFEGFDPDVSDFLLQLRLRNSKEYYEEVKPEYRRILLEPFKALMEDISPALLLIDPEFIVLPRVNKTISRMRRDTRFSKDKTMYRDTMWFYIRPRQYAWLNGAGFYFEVNPVGYHYGCGIFRAQPKQMALYREMIGENTRRFSRMTNKIEKQQHFALSGEMYKRDMAEGKLPKRLYDWYNRKAVYLQHVSSDMQRIQSPAFAQELAEQFFVLKDSYHFFRDVCDNFAQAELHPH